MRKLHLIFIALLLLGILAACASPEPEIQTVVEQVEVTRVVTETVVEDDAGCCGNRNFRGGGNGRSRD